MRDDGLPALRLKRFEEVLGIFMRPFCFNLLLLSCIAAVPFPGRASQPATGYSATNASPPGTGWFTSFRGGYVHQFRSSLDAGGELDVNRFAVEGSVGYQPSYTRSVALGVGYDLNDYGFSGSGGISGWGNVHTLRLGAPLRWGVDDHWTIFVIPSIRWNAEDGADWGQALEGGGFAGFSYRFGDRLTLGPGFGAITQLEDSTSFFPVLIIRWEITERTRLETGRGLGASQGPGLTLSYDVADDWQVLLGGRYERFRFRLDSNGATPNGVGEDRGVPLYLGVTWNWSRDGSVSLLGGARFAGKVRTDDSLGNELAASDYDVAPFLGFSFGVRF
jgi:hypothetical protein